MKLKVEQITGSFRRIMLKLSQLDLTYLCENMILSYNMQCWSGGLRALSLLLRYSVIERVVCLFLQTTQRNVSFLYCWQWKSLSRFTPPTCFGQLRQQIKCEITPSKKLKRSRRVLQTSKKESQEESRGSYWTPLILNFLL